MRRGIAAFAATGLVVAGLTALVALTFDGAHDGKIAGNEAMVLSAVWGLCGLGAAALHRGAGLAELRNAARILLAGAMIYLVMGALLGNGRWADPWARYWGYAGVLGSVWLSEWLLAPGEPAGGVGGLLALLAVVVGLGACYFEVIRWLEPVFSLPRGELLTAEVEALHRSTQVFLTLAVWSLYALIVMAAGAALRSPITRLLSAGLFGAALLYAALLGLTNPAASPSVRAAGLGSLAVGAVLSWLLQRSARGQQDRREQLSVAAAAAASVVVALAGLFIGR